MAIPDEHGAIVGSQRARQGQNIKGMRKVLLWGTLLTAIGFAVLLALFAGMESSDPNAGAERASPAAPNQPPPPATPPAQ